MPGVGKVPFCHDRHNQLPIRQRVHHRLRVIRGNTLPGQAVGFGGGWNQAVIRAIPFTAVPIGYGPFAEFYRVVGRPGQGRCDNRHRRGAAPGLANRAGGAVHGICPPLIQLIVVDDLPAAIGKITPS